MAHFTGRANSVNGRYQMIEDHICYPNVLDLPEVPDCAVITVAREAVEAIILLRQNWHR
jgi:acyl-CoA synthetase (NDP forming)